MKTRGGVFTTLVLAVAGCSGTPQMMMPVDAGADAGQMLTVVETCDLLAAAKCELNARCYAAFNRDAPQDCVSLNQSRCLAEYDTLKESFEGNRVEIDVTQVKTCEERMKTSACPPTFPPDYPAIAVHPFSDCTWRTGLLDGKLKSMALCDENVECADGLLCSKPNGVCAGTCTSYQAEGQPCALGCAAGLRCDDKGTMPTQDDVCAPLKELNQACNDSTECKPELQCNVTCRPRAKENEMCWFDAARLSTCEPGLACDVVPYIDGLTGTCVRPKGELEPCRFHWSCQPGFVCGDINWQGFPMMTPSAGVCVRPDVESANCFSTPYSVFVGDPCQAGLSCSTTTNTCTKIPSMNGDPCAPASQTCAGVGLYCRPSSLGTGTCGGPANVGERCAFTVDTFTAQIPCSAGYCDADGPTQSCRAAHIPDQGNCEEDGQCLSGRCVALEVQVKKCYPACD
ncbi:MAG: hypothetical protein JNK82_29195 [Myxococcaceae bacterium]|nr:hypothetical protein [Myxococcaceae bacterium]